MGNRAYMANDGALNWFRPRARFNLNLEIGVLRIGYNFGKSVKECLFS